MYWFNWAALSIFCFTWKQWRTVVVQGRTVRESIDWTQVESALKLNRIKRKKWPQIFSDLYAMQGEALEYLNRG